MYGCVQMYILNEMVDRRYNVQCLQLLYTIFIINSRTFIRFTTKEYQPFLHLFTLFITYKSYIIQYIYIDYIHPYIHYVHVYYNNGNLSFAYHSITLTQNLSTERFNRDYNFQ